jgi:hypothetical protein
MSASSASDIWAVGGTSMHFNGTTWTAFPVIGNDKESCGNNVCTSSFASLIGIADVSPTDAWAVGSITTETVTENPLSFNESTQAVIQNWNGSAWSLSAGATFAAGDVPSLRGVTATSAGDVWAVGSLLTDGGEILNLLFEHFDGTAWTATTIPVQDAFLFAVSADAPNDAWAVGFEGPENDNSRTLVMHYNGAAWQPVASPSVGSGASQLNAVLALSPSDVWAVGFSTPVAPPQSAATLTLIEHWDGSSWSVVSSPNVGPTSQFESNQLLGLTASSPSDIWAFGSTALANGSGNQQTLLLNWNGTAWSITPSPNPNGGSFLDDILIDGVAPSADNVWIVGSEDDAVTGGGFETLLLHTTAATN